MGKKNQKTTESRKKREEKIKQNFPWIRKYCKWIYQFIDRKVFGKKGDNGPFHMNDTEHLQDSVINKETNKDNKLKGIKSNNYLILNPLALKEILSHISKEDTYYYTSNRKNGTIMLGIDLDAHHGQQDAELAASWIKDTLLPSCYIESSTNGSGRHIYFLVNLYKYQSNSDINSEIRNLGNSIRELVKNNGFSANVDAIKGTLNIKSRIKSKINDKEKYIYQYSKLGVLLKIPRPLVQEQCDSLMSIQPYNLKDLTSKVEALMPTDTIVENNSNKDIREEESLKTVILGYTTDINVENKRISCSDMSKKKITSHKHIGPNSADANLRKLWAIRQLHMSLKRYPTTEEALSFYESDCNPNGPRDAKRIANIESALKYYTENNKPNPRSELLEIQPNIELVTGMNIPSEELKYKLTKTKSLKLTIKDVAAFVTITNYIVMTGTKTDSICASRERIMSLWDKLKEDGILDNACNNAKYKTLRELCQKYELIDIVADYIRPIKYGTTRIKDGKGYTIAPGRLHPLHLKGKSHIAEVQARANRDQPKLKLA